MAKNITLLPRTIETVAPSLECVRLPGRPTWQADATQLHNQAFEFWKRFWGDVYKSVGESQSPIVDEFVRQDELTIILHEGQIAALHGYAFWDLHNMSNREHSYFTRAFGEAAMQAMDAHRCRKVMTWEFFSIAPEWQGKAHGFSLGTVLLSLGIQAFLESGTDLLLGVGRVDVGAAQMAYKLGGIPLGPTIQLHGIPTDLVGILRSAARLTQKEKERSIAQALWENRRDLIRPPHAWPKKVA